MVKGQVLDYDKYNIFYDEYLVVMDMMVEFYLLMVECVFKNCEIVQNNFVVVGCKVDIGKIIIVVVKIVEGEKDDILVLGQCKVVFDLLMGLFEDKKVWYVEFKVGYYGIFVGGSWWNNICLLVLEFIDSNFGVWC